jgi:hypothetical protein
MGRDKRVYSVNSIHHTSREQELLKQSTIASLYSTVYRRTPELLSEISEPIQRVVFKHTQNERSFEKVYSLRGHTMNQLL